jgi:hypothetical protein
MHPEQRPDEAYAWQIRSNDEWATGRLDLQSRSSPVGGAWPNALTEGLEKHCSWVRHRYYQPDMCHVVLRVSPESIDTAERRFLLECISPGFEDLGDRGSEFQIRLRAYLRLCLFGDPLQQLHRELRARIEVALRGDGELDRVSCDEVVKYFDLVEWFHDGSKRLREEAWKAYAATRRVLQPNAPPLSTPQHWVSTKRLATPETVACRIALGTGTKLGLARSLDAGRIDAACRNGHAPWEAGEQAINAWLAIVKESRTDDGLQSAVEFMRGHAVAAALKALHAWVEPSEGTANVVRVRGAWSRGRLAVKLLGAVQDRKTELVPTTEEEQRRLVQDLGLVVLDALYEQKRDLENSTADGVHPHLPCDPKQFTQALIRMVALYAHRIVGVPYEIPIVPALREIFDLEAVFYLIKPRYRNHLYHVIDVAMLGELLIELGFKPFSSLDKKQWWVAALFHDMGYLAESISFAPGYLDSLGGDVFRRARKDLCSAVETAKNAIACHARDSLGLPDEGRIEADHGVASAIHLAEQLATLHVDRQDYQEAIIAIGWHAADQPRIDVKAYPLAALLLLCDELQEWQRGGVRAADIRQRLASAALFGESAAQWSNTMEVLTVTLADGTLQLEMRYADRASTEYDPVEIWVGKLKALERIAWPAYATVNLDMKVRSSRKGGRCSDLGLLRESIDQDPKLLSLRTFSDLLYRGEELKHTCTIAATGAEENLSVMLAKVGGMREWVIPRGSEVWKLLLHWRSTAFATSCRRERDNP